MKQARTMHTWLTVISNTQHTTPQKPSKPISNITARPIRLTANQTAHEALLLQGPRPRPMRATQIPPTSRRFADCAKADSSVGARL
jgi:hypothetical protein